MDFGAGCVKSEAKFTLCGGLIEDLSSKVLILLHIFA
jgi:hypothetical protein